MSTVAPGDLHAPDYASESASSLLNDDRTFQHSAVANRRCVGAKFFGRPFAPDGFATALRAAVASRLNVRRSVGRRAPIRSRLGTL